MFYGWDIAFRLSLIGGKYMANVKSSEVDEQNRIMQSMAELESKPKLATLDLIVSVVVFLFGMFVFISGIYMCFFAVTGTDVWYYSPGLFPCFIGTILMLTSIVLFSKKNRNGARITKELFHISDEKSLEALRLILAVGLFVCYVFVLIGAIPFTLATFLYLSITMIVFRKPNYPIWKLLLISAVATGIIYLIFGVIASVPLP